MTSTITDDLGSVGTSSSADDLDAVRTSKAVKVPCYVATTANITLSGEQTIDGQSVTAGKRVLVWQQSSAVDNGIWICAQGTWSRAIDFDSSSDLAQGTRVFVANGTSYGSREFQLTTSSTITIGSTLLTFALSNTLLPTSVTALSYLRGNAGGTAYEGRTPAQVSTDITSVQSGTGAQARSVETILREYRLSKSAFDTVVNANAAATGRTLYFPSGSHAIAANITFAATVTLEFEQGAKLVPAAGVTVTINGQINAPLTQIFDLAAAGSAIGGLARVPVLYPEWFGALGDSSTNDYTAIHQCITTAIAAAGIPVVFRKARYMLGTKLSYTGVAVPVSLIGAGDQETQLKWTNNDGGISIAFTNGHFPPTVIGMALLNDGLAQGTAIAITSAVLAQSSFIGPVVRNVEIRGDDTTAECWQNGVVLTEVWNGIVESVSVRGIDDSSTPFDALLGIYCLRCQAMQMRALQLYYCNESIKLEGATLNEGHKISDFECVPCTTGIKFTGNPAAGVVIQRGHINSFVYGIDGDSQYQLTISDLLIYKYQGSAEDWVGINLDDVEDALIHDVIFRSISGATGANTAIVASSIDRSTIHDVRIVDWAAAGNGIVLSTATENNIHHCEGGTNVGEMVIVSSGVPNRITDCFPIPPADAFAANDATPSVGNTRRMWKTANNSATTITDFDDSWDGQEFTLLIDDNNTTIQHNSGLILAGAVDVTPSSGSIFTFYSQSAVWREKSRTFGTTSGIYTPTLTSVANVDASTAYACQYIRVGNVVSVWGKLDINPTAAGPTVTQLGISLPFASNLANAHECQGSGNAADVASQPVSIVGDAANNRAELNFVNVSATGAFQVNFSFGYRII